jgi:hypothetical protein
MNEQIELVEHSITVKRLTEILTELRDDDVLVPNTVRNLAVLRGGHYIGFVNLIEVEPKLELDE